MGLISATRALTERTIGKQLRQINDAVEDAAVGAAKAAAPHVWHAAKTGTGAVLTGVGAGVTVGGKVVKHGLSASDKIIGRIGAPGHWLGKKLASHPEALNLVKYDEKDGYKLNKKGKLAIGGLILGGAAMDGANEQQKLDMGTIDGKIYTATPDYSAYAKAKAPKTTYSPAPAGADGSLVFALDRTKNGGFL